MTPKDHLAAGSTRKVVVLKDLSNGTYPNPELLLITSLKSKKYFQKICHLQKMKLLYHIRLYRYHFIGNTITYLSLAGSASIMCGGIFYYVFDLLFPMVSSLLPSDAYFYL